MRELEFAVLYDAHAIGRVQFFHTQKHIFDNVDIYGNTSVRRP